MAFFTGQAYPLLKCRLFFAGVQLNLKLCDTEVFLEMREPERVDSTEKPVNRYFSTMIDNDEDGQNRLRVIYDNFLR